MAQHGVVKEALEMAIPRLREMFGESNLQLVNVDVGQRNAGDQHSLQQFSQQARDDFGLSDEADGNGAFLEDADDTPIVVTTHNGLLDDYA